MALQTFQKCKKSGARGIGLKTSFFMDAGTTVGGAVKKLREMQTYKKQKKNVANYVCFCSATMLTSKKYQKL